MFSIHREINSCKIICTIFYLYRCFSKSMNEISLFYFILLNWKYTQISLYFIASELNCWYYSSFRSKCHFCICICKILSCYLRIGIDSLIQKIYGNKNSSFNVIYWLYKGLLSWWTFANNTLIRGTEPNKYNSILRIRSVKYFFKTDFIFWFLTVKIIELKFIVFKFIINSKLFPLLWAALLH